MNGKRLYRSAKDKWIGGVCGGIAEYLGADPLLVRLIFLVFGAVDGVGLFVYLLLLVIVPKEKAAYRPSSVSPDGTSQPAVSGAVAAPSADRNTSVDRRLVAGISLIGLGLVFALRIGFPHLPMEYMFGAALIALGIYIVVRKV